MNDEYISTELVAKILGLGVSTIYAYRARGTLGIEPVGTFGNCLTWKRAEVEHLARTRRAAA